ncbi:MAG: DUF3857 domain-containing protein [Planctomycetota bacterium]
MRWLPWRVLAIVALTLGVAAPAVGDEAIYLTTGEEYRGMLLRVADGQVVARVDGKERSFALAKIQRIEFQRPRAYDDVTEADQLPDLPVFEAIEPKTAALRRRFPQAGHVVLYDSTRVHLKPEGRYAVERVRAWRILHERAADTAKQALYYFPDRQDVTVLYGLTVAPDGTVSRAADSAMKDEALYAAQPAYNYQHRFRFTLRGPVPGATLILATRRTGTATPLVPLVVDRVFHATEPALHREVRLIREEGAETEVSATALNGLGEAKDGVWAVENSPQIFPEPLMPPRAAFSPRLVLAAPKTTWSDLAAALAERCGAKAHLRKKGLTPRALFDFVRTDLRVESVPLDALPEGPARPSVVLDRGYGTEVERALLLAALLRGAGGKAEVVLVRERDDGPLAQGAPRLHGLNRAVLRTADAEGKPLWLQADAADRGWGELDPEVQGADGLSLATGETVTVPVLPPAAESQVRAVEVELAADGSAKVTERYRLRGQYAKAYRDLRTLTETQLTKWVTRLVGRERTGVHLIAFEHSEFARANPEETMRLVYRVPALAERAGQFLLLRLPNAEASATDVGRSTRRYDLFWEGAEREETAFTVLAPEGYKVYALGESLEASGAGWSAAAGFESDPAQPRVVRFRDVWERSALAAPQDAYPAYRAARIRRSQLRGQIIVFARH